MNKYSLTAVMLLAATAAWLYHSRTQPAPAFSAADTPQAPEAHTPVARPAMPGSSVEDNETVLAVRARKDRNCNLELRDYVSPGGEMFSAYTCTPIERPAPHPYEHYTNDSLETLAYSDAQAAALLGKRLAGDDHDRSYEMLIRATALDGNADHLAWLGDVSFGTYRIDGQLQVDAVKRRYELAALAAQLGEDPEFSLFLRDELLAAGVSDEQVGQLDAQGQALRERIRDIQVTVYGEVRHGGHDNA